MDLFLFILFSAGYIMIVHFAMAIKKEFNLFLIIGYFILAGVIGWWMKSYEMGLVVGVVLSLVFY